MTPISVSVRRVLLMTVLLVIVASIYMITYNGSVESGDTLRLFNATGSLVRHGDWLLDIMAHERVLPILREPQAEPLQALVDDPLSVVLTIPLYALAYVLPGVGLIHAVWLFNILIGAAICGLVWAYALTLGYDERVAFTAALVCGIGTGLWGYSKTLFQEPLTALITLAIAYCGERWRQGGYRSRVWLLWLVVNIVLLPIAKSSAVAALPGLLILMLPRFRLADHLTKWLRWGEIFLLTLIVIGVVIVSYVDLRGTGLPYLSIPTLRFALHTYLFSIGGSIWGTAPLLLLGVPGALMWQRRGDGRIGWGLLLILLAYAFGYAVLSGVFWTGGLSWPQRFLLPIVPLLLIGTLPALEWLFKRWWGRLIFALLFIYGLWIQINSVMLGWDLYPNVLPPDTGLEWTGTANNFYYMRWFYLPRFWGRIPFNFAWIRMDTPLVPLAFAVLTLVSAGIGVSLLRAKAISRRWYGVALLPLVWIGMLWGSLRAWYIDPLYYSAEMDGLIPLIDQQTQPGDWVYILNPQHRTHMFNYGKNNRWRPLTVTFQPGERYDPQAQPQVYSDNPEALLFSLTGNIARSIGLTHSRVFLLADSGPDQAWTLRPFERLLTELYHPIRTTQQGTARLIEFSTVPSPDPRAFRNPTNLTELVYGDALRLVGYELPQGTTYTAGEVLPLSLYWQIDQPPTSDPIIAWFLVNTSDPAIRVQGQDSTPQNGFIRGGAWQAGVPVWDNRAVIIPADLPAGEYQLWIVVYQFIDGAPQNLVITSGDSAGDGIGVLPIVIEISR